ncbi:uncharacterized domain 1-containing protein [Thalassobacillus cyri]|uniref:Uncharacterized domain 1-containing protein n=1 Tax=Thalassobacillus cyri TaxID=571932 RepID=A0A1H4A9Y9_9BACI|nr:PaaI family thioesterase [Thalassobacillus cyri]SEA32501.1 uncharacterized domain 1-containing protein [Thalassobacillus cyri]
MVLTMDVEDIRKEFENCPYFHYMGLEIIFFEKENVRIQLNIKPEFLNTNGTLHGGVYAAAIDFIQSMHLRSVTNTRCVTTNLTIHFTAPIKTGTIFAEASIISRGHKTAFVDGILKDENGKVISKGTGTFKLIYS